MKNSSRYFCNKECEYYPCHNFHRESFYQINCLFCMCPLFPYDCGGEYIILDNGNKDCSKCCIPHDVDDGYDYVINFLKNFKNGRLR